MKRFILLPVLIFCFSAGNSMAQRAASNGGAGTYSNYSNASGATREVSYSSAPPATSNYTSHSEPASRPVQENRSASAPMSNNSGHATLQGNTRNNNSTAASYAPGNTRSVSNNHGTIYTINGAMRYNYAAKKPYPYYPSAHKRHSDKRTGNGTHLITPEYAHRQYPGYNPFYTCYYVFDDVPDNSGSLASGNNALHLSLDGYIVYGTDTLDGIVTLTNSTVFLEHPTDAKQEYGYRISYTDKSLKTIVVYNGDNTLFLSRASVGDKMLSRVLHGGKLTIYDDAYSFPTPNNIDKTHIKVSYNGQVKRIGKVVTLDPKYALIRELNKAYNLKLKAEDYTWQSLIAYINKLQ